MDAREALRRYLEQRKDFGETELVLDSLTVDEVLRLVGAGGTESSAQSVGPAPDWRSALGGQPPISRGLAEPASTPSTAQPRAPASESRAPTGRSTRADEAAAGQKQAEPRPSGEHDAAIEHAAGASRRVALEQTKPVEPAQVPPGIVVGSPTHELFAGTRSPWTSLDDIAQAVSACSLCSLAQGAKNPVPGEGNPNADLVCVGEAPGATEDELGRPFVGQAGQLLTKILAAINLSREEVFICNVLKHRPPGNRNPLPEEVKACSPYLVRQIQLLSPRVILALGTFAAQTLLQTKEPIGKLRGRIHRYYGVPLIVTYHPAALLRNPSWKRPTWEDVQLARRILDRQHPAPA